MLYRWSYCKGGIPKKIDGKNQIKWNAWPKTVEGDFWKLCQYLYTKNVVPHFYEDGEPIEQMHDAKTCVPSISGAVYKDGEKRGKEFIQNICLLILDVDNKGGPETHLTWDLACEIIAVLPYRAYLYTTYSHTEQRNKFRVILPLARPVRPDLWKEFLEWAVAHLGLKEYREALDLGCMRKPAQIYFLQGAWDPAGIMETYKDGEDLLVPDDADLEVIPVPVLPGEASKKAFEPGEWDFIKNCNVNLCTLDLAAVLRHRGIEVGEDRQLAGGTKNRCHCPWASQHTGGRDDDGAYIVQMDDKWPIFHCSHSNHQDLRLQDVLDWAGAPVFALYGEPYHRSTAMKLKLGGSIGSLSFGGAK